MLLHSANQGGGETELQKSKKLSSKDRQQHMKHPPTTDTGPAGAEIILGAEVIRRAQHGQDHPALHQVHHGLEPLHPQRLGAHQRMECLGAQQSLPPQSLQSLGAQLEQKRLQAKKRGVSTHVFLLRYQHLKLQLLRWVMQLQCQLLHPTHLHLQLLHRRSQWRLMGRLTQRRSTRSSKR